MLRKGNHLVVKLSVCLFLAGFCVSTASAAYDPPIGIPAPPFGIEESHTMYAGQTYAAGGFVYRDAGNGPYTHYIDNTHPSATDTANPYGTAEVPRMTLLAANNTYPAGSVVEIHGGPYEYAATWRNITGNGTVSNPVFYRGTDPANMPQIKQITSHSGGMRVQLYGSYFIIENLEFTGECIPKIKDGTDHISFRSCEIDNEGSYTNYAAAISNAGNYNVVYNNYIHHNERALDVDSHGTTTASGTSYFWVLDNEISYNSGDAFQAAHRAAVAPHHIYIGRNVMHHDRENGVDLKTIDDIIISENIIYGYVDSSTSNGDAVVVGSNGYSEQYGPLRSWFLFNEIYSSQTGLRFEGAEDCWVIGNTFHDIVGDAIQFDIDVDSDNVNVIHNTIVSAGGDGIHHHWKAGATNLRILGNIISDIGDAHVEISQAMIPAFIVENNLFYQNGSNVVVEMGNTFYYSQSASTYNAFATWANNVIGNPMFVDEAGDNYRIQSGSAAIDIAVETTAYATFQSLYGIDIRVDMDEASRPNGAGWDAGAYEYYPPVVTGRYVFYNNSAWDGNDPAANASDDAAIATNKFALLPTGTADFTNYTSYSKGINGIMIDATGTGGAASASDFTFKVGNDSTTSGWSAGPAPASVAIRPGAGDSGSDRITITFADGAIVGKWLEVTYIAASDVFYFGNAPGETGNSVTDAEVTPTDEVYVRNNPATLAVSSASISHAGDFNRDKKVGPTDQIIGRNNGTNSSTALQLITVP